MKQSNDLPLSLRAAMNLFGARSVARAPTSSIDPRDPPTQRTPVDQWWKRGEECPH